MQLTKLHRNNEEIREEVSMRKTPRGKGKEDKGGNRGNGSEAK